MSVVIRLPPASWQYQAVLMDVQSGSTFVCMELQMHVSCIQQVHVTMASHKDDNLVISSLLSYGTLLCTLQGSCRIQSAGQQPAVAFEHHTADVWAGCQGWHVPHQRHIGVLVHLPQCTRGGWGPPPPWVVGHLELVAMAETASQQCLLISARHCLTLNLQILLL
jgi:hypothetical protein